MVTITELQEDEVGAAATAFSSFFAECGAAGRYNVDYCTAYWTEMFRAGRVVCVVAKDPAGIMVGVCAGLILLDMFTGLPTCYEAIWYVMPEHKGVGIKLFKRWEKLSRERGAVRLVAGHGKWQCVDMKKLYNRMGYEPYETTYLKTN